VVVERLKWFERMIVNSLDWKILRLIKTGGGEYSYCPFTDLDAALFFLIL
jgi:hypothetical protein